MSRAIGGEISETIAEAIPCALSRAKLFAKSCRRQRDATQEKARIKGDVEREVNNTHAKHGGKDKGLALPLAAFDSGLTASADISEGKAGKEPCWPRL